MLLFLFRIEVHVECPGVEQEDRALSKGQKMPVVSVAVNVKVLSTGEMRASVALLASATGKFPCLRCLSDNLFLCLSAVRPSLDLKFSFTGGQKIQFPKTPLDSRFSNATH
jgi:hypothetical protein